MSKFDFRLARPTEAIDIANLSRALIEYGLVWRWTPARVASSIGHPNTNVLVACSEGEIGGFGIMRYGDEQAHLDLLAVAPPYRRARVGCRLLQWLEECAVVAGIFNVELEVRAGNEGARLFYERMGYRKLADLPGYYQGKEAALRMSRDMSGLPSTGGTQARQQQAFKAEERLEKIFGVVPAHLKAGLSPGPATRNV